MYPTELAKVRPPVVVNHALVETPVLVSKEGAALTSLNWTGAALAEVKGHSRPPIDTAAGRHAVPVVRLVPDDSSP